MTHARAVLWLDHQDAHLIDFTTTDHRVQLLSSPDAPRKVHHKAGGPGSGHIEPNREYFDDLADHVAAIGQVLVTGPGTAKVEFERFLTDRRPDARAHVIGVETLDHPSDGELLAFARTYFDRLQQLGMT